MQQSHKKTAKLASEYAFLHGNNKSDESKFFNEKIKPLNIQKKQELKMLIDSHVGTLEQLRSPFANPKMPLMWCAIVIGVFLQYKFSMPMVSILPVVFCVITSCLDWRNTGKFILGYQALKFELDCE